MKKRNLSLLLTHSSILFSAIVSAGPVQGVEQLLTGLGEMISIIIAFLSDTILRIDSFDEFLFAKILLFSIILLVTYTVIKKNKMFKGRENKGIQWIISISVAILSIRYLPDDFVQAILLQYGTLALGIGIFLPLIIFFFFLHQSEIGPSGRKMGWIVYGVSFIAIWIFRYDEVGEANIIYWIGLGAVLILLLFDSSVHKHLGMSSIRKMMEDAKVQSRVNAQAELEKLAKNRQHYTQAEYNRLRSKWMEIVEENI